MREGGEASAGRLGKMVVVFGGGASGACLLFGRLVWKLMSNSGILF